MILEKSAKILEIPVCNHCLGRQFAQLLHGYTNEERGKILRTAVAMSIDNLFSKNALDMSNFHGYGFYNIKSATKRKKCAVCNDIFDELEKISEKIIKKKVNFRTFLIGTKLSHELIEKEENLWEKVGIDFCEPIKAEINRELGKLIEKAGYIYEPKRPDVNFILNVEQKNVTAEVNPLFIYGEYQKLVRGIPQTKWPSGKYKTSVEQIIAKPFMKVTGGKAHKLHGCGREDINARCLGWRPFVLEIIEPKKRNIDVKETARKVVKKIKLRGMRFSDIVEVRKIKEVRYDKTYRAIVKCKNLDRKDLKKLTAIKEIRQRTPSRVIHRRADLWRKRKVISLKTKYINKKTFELTVRTEAGLYVKELISGDKGRTQPSVSSVLVQNCVCKELDVLTIHKK